MAEKKRLGKGGAKPSESGPEEARSLLKKNPRRRGSELARDAARQPEAARSGAKPISESLRAGELLEKLKKDNENGLPSEIERASFLEDPVISRNP
jgi:hypothetical protein